MRETPKPYEIYRHFKGNSYQILNIAVHSETLEEMVVYQQLYEPYAVYVRPLEMFLSKVDKEKYPDVAQEYRFEKVTLKEQKVSEPQVVIEQAEEVKPIKAQEKEVEEPVTMEEEEFQLEPGLLRFLEADSYEEKLEILTQLHPTITDAMIDTMAVSLDMEVKQGELEQRYSELMNSLLTLEHFECNRLR